MPKFKSLYTLLIVFLVSIAYSFGQSIDEEIISENEYFVNEYPYWVDMMNDHTVNFYDVQEAFNEYFKDKPRGKGTGWKQFKRWEWFMEQRVYPSGDRIPQAQAWNEIMEFNKKYPPKELSGRGNWEDLGPHTYLNNTGHWNPGLGRINVIVRDPLDENLIYIGAPSGGLWRTYDEGENWEVLTDDLPVLGVSGVALHPTNPNIIYIATGDKDASDNYSIGVLKSEDGGVSWNETGLSWNIQQNRVICKLLMHPNNPDILFAATSAGLFRTKDAGETWTNQQTGDMDDLEFKPGDPDVIYALTTKIYKSTNGGDSFTMLNSVNSSGRAQIAVTEAAPEYIYFFSSTGGIYRSTDSGETFEFRSTNPSPGYQSWYDMAAAASHIDPEEFHIGEINTFRSYDGGITWQQTTDWTWDNNIGYTHCDIHEMVFYDGTLYVGSDGLISKSTDNGNNWTDLSVGINIRQFYRIGASQNSLYKILGGSQDNGTSVYTEDHWHEWLGADGMECVVNYENENIVYGTSQNGNFYKSDQGGNFGNVNISQPGGGNWITPFVMHPQDPDILFVGNNRIRKTINGFNSWTTIYSGGGGNFNTLSIANSNPDYLYASRSSAIIRTKDGGQNWTDISFGLPNLFISYIAVHPSDPELIAVSLSGFEEGEKVFISYDAGDTWENYSINLPNLPANCVAFVDDVQNGLYVGMDVGIYYKDATMTEWISFMSGLPNVIVNELDIHHGEGKIRAATYGRGLWESDILMSEPVALFEATTTYVPIECGVDFTSLSSGCPESYLWTFEGGDPATSTDKNPSGIIYHTDGVYDVTLEVSNALGSHTLTMEDYIEVSNTLLPDPQISASERYACSNAIITFTDETMYCPMEWTWEFIPNTVQFVEGTDEHSQNPVVQFLEGGPYTVSLTAVNANGSFTNTFEDYIAVGGAYLPFTESFEEGLDAKGWTVLNPDNGKTWELIEMPGNPGAMYVNIFNYLVPPGQRDQLISPAINLTGWQDPVLTFIHAYAKKYEAVTDSLIIYISDNCGDTWSRIFAAGDDGSYNFATHEITTDEFIPSGEEDWCGNGFGSSCYSIDLSPWANMPDVKLMFESYNYLGNNLFIDEIEISGTVSTGPALDITNFISIYPNPNNGLVYIEMSDDIEGCTAQVLNIQGQVVASVEISNSKTTIDLSSEPKGIYFIDVSNNDSREIQKIVVQ